MIPYDLIVTASHRPHLLGPTLSSLLAQVDQPPARILIHDDAVPVFQPVVGPNAARRSQVDELATLRAQTHAVLAALNPLMPVIYTWADPPRRLGLALRFLLDNVSTDYVLYSQDDHVVVRPLPIQRALALMHEHTLHQIRFNKRATVAFKDTWQGRWTKEEVRFPNPGWDALPPNGLEIQGATTLTVADHWYFQTGLWRVAPIRAAVQWVTCTPTRREILRLGVAEEAINRVLDGHLGPIPGLSVPHPQDAHEPRTRRQIQRTFIWGPIGEDRYIRHIGGASPSGSHPRDGGTDDPARAWREIDGYRPSP